MRTRTVVAALLAVGLLAAGPSPARPENVDHEVDLSRGAGFEVTGAPDTGAVNVWTHMSLWDANTCSSSSPDNRCERILVHALEDGEATISLSATYPVADYDLVVYDSGKSGEAYNAIAQQQSEVRPVPGEGPVPIPGDEVVTFEVDEDGWYLAVVFYRAAGGGYTLTGELA